jgi:6-pyruvoyl-tetrahydropterin synthase
METKMECLHMIQLLSKEYSFEVLEEYLPKIVDQLQFEYFNYNNEELQKEQATTIAISLERMFL